LPDVVNAVSGGEADFLPGWMKGAAGEAKIDFPARFAENKARLGD